MEREGFETIRLMGCEGVVAGHDDASTRNTHEGVNSGLRRADASEENLNLLEGAAWEAWVELNYRLSQDAALIGASDHLLYIGRR